MSALLPDSFFEWWFAPWAWVDGGAKDSKRLPHETDSLGLQDGYRLWCRQADVAPDLPPAFDPGWQAAVTISGDELIGAARLFGGLLAAREHDRAALDALSLDERRWCASIAATQPLRGRQIRYADDDGIEVRGLVELASRLDRDFHGMWSRLRLLLPPALADRTAHLLPQTSNEGAGAAATQRVQRCWGLCRRRSESVAGAGI